MPGRTTKNSVPSWRSNPFSFKPFDAPSQGYSKLDGNHFPVKKVKITTGRRRTEACADEMNKSLLYMQRSRNGLMEFSFLARISAWRNGDRRAIRWNCRENRPGCRARSRRRSSRHRWQEAVGRFANPSIIWSTRLFHNQKPYRERERDGERNGPCLICILVAWQRKYKQNRT